MHADISNNTNLPVYACVIDMCAVLGKCTDMYWENPSHMCLHTEH